MSRSSVTVTRFTAIFGLVLGVGSFATTPCQGSALSKRNTVQELQTLPANSVVHLIGVVTYVDEAGKLFWLEDETGAVPIKANPLPAAVLAGAKVAIEATKATGNNDLNGPSTIGLQRMKVHPAESTLVPPSAVQFLPTPADFLQIKRRGPADLAVIRSAPFWIPPAIPTMVALFLLMVFATLMWVYILRRRVRQQTAALRKASETTQAIHDLSSAMLQVTVRRQFETEVSVRGSNEVADLVVGFNTMLSELQRRDRAMREAEARLQHLTLIDDLTGLPNRRLLTDRLSQSLAKARRENRKVALLYIDLDGFKLINDSLGHGAGDALLGQVAQRLKSRFRQSDTLARIGGDEFTLILDNVQTWADGDKAAVSVLEVLKEPFELEGHSIKMTASIGISIFPDHGNEGGQLLQQADCAMFAAKRNGKNRIVQFGDGLGSAARERLTLEGELRRAIENNEITIHYQPEFDLASNKIVRFEALARWFHPKLGTIPPLNFIPIAEESGLIVPLGAYVMERACADAVTWQSRAGRPIQVAVNVSSVQFARDSFLEEVEEALHRTGLRPSLLQLEITESATLTGVERAADLIRRLTGKGIGVAMDDFGTGYSCLSYLPRLSLDALKLDRSFGRVDSVDGAQPAHEGDRRGHRDERTAGTDESSGHQ
jgi:diguanylate cyclase (GGDEF)-like protein